MIHKKQRKKIKEVIGNRYTDEVLKILKKNKITNRKGIAYGTSMIRNVFNGINENKAIENAILELYIQNIEKSERTEALKNELLGITDS